MANDYNHFFAGALIGGLIGGLTALALSPKTGKEFRQSVMEQVSSLLEKSPQQKEKIFETEKESFVRSGIPLNHYKPKQNLNMKNDVELKQAATKIIDEATSGNKPNINIEKLLADTEKAISDVEQKYTKE